MLSKTIRYCFTRRAAICSFRVQKILHYPQRYLIQNPFVAPIFQEREDKRIPIADTKEIFKKIDQEHSFLNYNQAVEILSNLAYIVIPFDKTSREYNLLLFRLKLLLQNQSGGVKLYDLIDASIRLGIDSFTDIIRQKIKEGNFSRIGKDICACLYLFSYQYKHHKQAKDLEIYKLLLRDLKHMQTEDLKIEQINLIIKAFSMCVDFSNDLEINEDFKLIEGFMPKLLQQNSYELTRCQISDIILIMDGYYKLWNKNVFKNLQMEDVYKQCQAFLDQYLGLSKKDITGSQFASLVEHVAKAKEARLFQFDDKLVQKLQHIFINDQAELYIFTISDILKIFKGFETVNTYFNRDKVINAIVQVTMETESYQDDDFLELMKCFLKIGVLEQDENLMFKARSYFDSKFELMERQTMLEYLEFYKDLGMLFQDKYIMITMSGYFDRNYHQFSTNEICSLYKLLSHNFYRGPEIVNLVEDTLKIRLSESSEREKITSRALMDLIAGINMFSQYNKKLDFILRRQLKEGNHLFIDKQLLVVSIAYLSDFNIKIDEILSKKLEEAILTHIDNFEQRELVHLLLYGNILSKTSINELEKRLDISKLENDIVSLEKLALIKKYKFSEEQAQEYFSSLMYNSNAIEVVEGIIKKMGLSYQKNKLICDGYLRAPIIVGDKGYIIDILEQDMGNYQKDNQTLMKHRSTVANDLVREYGYKGLKYISLLEMDFAVDESVYLKDIIDQTNQ